MDETAEPFPAQPEIARYLPGYRLLRQLSQTSMSSVYLAEEVALGRRVALKVLGPELAARPGFRARFKREVALAAKLDHPNVIPIYAAGDSAELCYLAMRYVDGPDLRRILHDQGPLDIGRAAHILWQVAAALDVAHEAGLVHRDVKPGNILVDSRTGQVYLTDFGIARGASAQTLTVQGEVVGTPGYISPEQIQGGTLDRRADVYSLGCVAYHCLTGQKPYLRANPLAVLWAHMHDQPAPVTSLRPDLPSTVDGVFGRALAKSPDDRQPNCSTLVTELTAAAPPPGPPIGGPSGGAPAGQRSRWRRLTGVAATARRHPWLTAALLVGVLVAGAAMTAVRWGGAPDPDVLAQVPAPLRDGCRTTEGPNLPGASATLSCRTGDGYDVVVNVFADQSGVDSGYQRAVDESGVERGTGDCAAGAPAEHRHPGAGAAAGRLLCFPVGATANLVWTDERARIVARTTAPAGRSGDLYRAWTGWTGAPAFPAAEEQALLDLLAETDCERPLAGTLDRFPAAIAAVKCVPRAPGARTVSYYRFGTVAELQSVFDRHASEAMAPVGDSCLDSDASGFLGNRRYDLRSVELGGLLCHPGPASTLVMEWSVEPLRVLGVAVGTDPDDLSGWWESSYGPTTAEIVKAVNAQASPPFPSEREQALLAHVPERSRRNCVRPSSSQIKTNVPDSPVVAVVCGPTSGASIVFYYQFPDVPSMRANYALGTPEGPDCRTLPPEFTGESAYSRGGATGRLTCHTNESGNRYLIWTDERFAIQVMAFQGGAPAAMIDWWRRDAGPISPAPAKQGIRG